MNSFLQTDAVWRCFIGNLKDCAIIILDEEGNVTAWNEAAPALKSHGAARHSNGHSNGHSNEHPNEHSNVHPNEIIGRHFSEFYTPEARMIGQPQRELDIAASAGRHEEEGWRLRNNGSRFWAHEIINAIYDETGTLCGFGKVVRDLTEHKQAVEQSANIMKLLETTARTDYLTGLDNRRSLDQAMLSVISAARRRQGPFSLAMIDFDRFNDYNQQHGHKAGDAYLTKAAKIWRKSLRPEDFIARYGGEEFVVILPDTPCDAAIVCLDRLRAMTPAPLTCSAGLAQWDGTESPSALLGRADVAVHAAKNAGRNCLITAPNPALTNKPAPMPEAKAAALRSDNPGPAHVASPNNIRGFRALH